MSNYPPVTDSDGDTISTGCSGDRVYLSIGDRAVCLDKAMRERFAQSYVAASLDADANAERMRLDAEAVREEALEAAEMAADRRAYFDID